MQSIKGSSCTLVGFFSASGNPRYLTGKSSNWQGRHWCIFTITSADHCIGTTLLFCTVVLRPKAPQKSCNMLRVRSILLAVGVGKRTTSSTYKDNG
jgi:hypothetical protein